MDEQILILHYPGAMFLSAAHSNSVTNEQEVLQ